MLLLNLILLIDVTFSTPTPDFDSYDDADPRCQAINRKTITYTVHPVQFDSDRDAC